MESPVSKIALLIEQTMFLIAVEKQAFLAVKAKMSALLSTIQEKIAQYKDQESKETLESISNNVQIQLKEMEEDMQEDVSFLETQLQTMQEISKVEDPERREALSDMVLAEAGELLSMIDFKKQVEDQSTSAQEEFFSMIEDMENAIQEGKEEELLLLMESMENEVCCDDENCENECDENECPNESCEGECDECYDDENDECCDDETCDEESSHETLTNDLEKDLHTVQMMESKKCCKSDEGCKGNCRCKGNCKTDA